ncbi:hypothetical protein A2U01_0078710, partial [Trifolium medium]|nr:hypothetical protein [Trifolium medium]
LRFSLVRASPDLQDFISEMPPPLLQVLIAVAVADAVMVAVIANAVIAVAATRNAAVAV